jgi:hypothetical protein
MVEIIRPAMTPETTQPTSDDPPYGLFRLLMWYLIYEGFLGFVAIVSLGASLYFEAFVQRQD